MGWPNDMEKKSHLNRSEIPKVAQDDCHCFPVRMKDYYSIITRMMFFFLDEAGISGHRGNNYKIVAAYTNIQILLKTQ